MTDYKTIVDEWAIENDVHVFQSPKTGHFFSHIAGAHPRKEAGIARFFEDVFHTPASHTMHDQGLDDHFRIPTPETFCSDRAYSLSACSLLGTFPIRMPSVISQGRAYSSQLLASHEASSKSRHPNIMATKSLQLGTKVRQNQMLARVDHISFATSY